MIFKGMVGLIFFLLGCDILVPDEGEGLRTVLKIPHNTHSVPPLDSGNTVVIQSGDTLYSIAKRYNVPLRDLIAVNQLYPPYIRQLRVGQKLRIPKLSIHSVSRGENLYRIALKYNVNIHDLGRVNHLNEDYIIFPGQQLIIPSEDLHEKEMKQKSVIVSAEKSKEMKKISAIENLPKRESKKFLWPVAQGRVVKNFGDLGGGLRNDGLDIESTYAADVYAAENGTVIYISQDVRSMGALVLIKHAGSFVTAYAYLGRIDVQRGGSVKRGDRIGGVGYKPGTQSAQVHFQIRQSSKPMNPRDQLESFQGVEVL